MKKKLLLLMAACVCVFAACSDNDDKAIEVSKGQQLDQTVYADDEKGSSDVSFTVADAWTSTISGVKTREKGPVPSPDWISISPDHGDQPGAYTVAINLTPNYTGKDRNATITINCNGDNIEIKVKQEATTEEGEVPAKEGVYEPGFLGVLEKGDLLLLSEEGKVIEKLYSFNTSDVPLLNCDEAIAHVYFFDANSMEVCVLNLQTEETKALSTKIDPEDYYLVSADGKYIVYDSRDSKKKIIKRTVADGKETVLYESDERIHIGTVSKDGKYVVATVGNTAKVFEGDKEKYSFEVSGGQYIQTRLSPNEDKVVVHDRDSNVYVYHLDGSNKKVIVEGGDELSTVKWSADGKYVYLNYTDNNNKLYRADVETGKIELSTILPQQSMFRSGTLPVKYIPFGYDVR